MSTIRNWLEYHRFYMNGTIALILSIMFLLSLPICSLKIVSVFIDFYTIDVTQWWLVWHLMIYTAAPWATKFVLDVFPEKPKKAPVKRH